MAKTTLTKTNANGNFAAAFKVLTMTAADTSNQNDFACSGDDLIVAWNSGASQHTITLTSVTYPPGRSGTITAETIEAGVIKIFGPMKAEGWMQSDGKIYIEANHVEVKFGIIKLR